MRGEGDGPVGGRRREGCCDDDTSGEPQCHGGDQCDIDRRLQIRGMPPTIAATRGGLGANRLEIKASVDVLGDWVWLGVH